MAKRLLGKEVTAALNERIKADVAALEAKGVKPTLGIIRVGGRSLVVGKPAAMMLIKKNATVTVCHTRTVDMPSVVKEADIVIVAAGRAGVVDDTYLREGQVVIDVGINVNAEGKLCGDVDFEKAGYIRYGVPHNQLHIIII